MVKTRAWSQTAGVQVLALPLSCAATGKSLTQAALHFSAVNWGYQQHLASSYYEIRSDSVVQSLRSNTG